VRLALRDRALTEASVTVNPAVLDSQLPGDTTDGRCLMARRFDLRAA